jgi:hypothetical protein
MTLNTIINYLAKKNVIWKVLVSPAKKENFIANFQFLGLVTPKNKLRAKKIRLSRGVAVRSLVVWAGLMLLILRKFDFFYEIPWGNSGVNKIKKKIEIFVIKMPYGKVYWELLSEFRNSDFF